MKNLVWNIKNGELDQVEEFIKIKQIDVNSQIEGRYPLHFAADFGQIDVLSFLIEKGAKVNVVDKHEITPLLAAIWEGHTKCVQMLIERGASTTGTTPDGVPYIEVAEKEDIRALLLKMTVNDWTMFLAFISLLPFNICILYDCITVHEFNRALEASKYVPKS